MRVRRRHAAHGLWLAALLLAAPAARGAEWWVSPAGTTSTSAGTGTRDNPWALATALAGPSAVRPGDTIWLLAGTYRGTFTAALSGTAAAPLLVRAAPGARATLDGGSSGGAPVLRVAGAYVWFRDLEVTSSDPVRASSQRGPWPTDLGRGEGVQIVQTAGSGVGVKFIDLVVHDTRQGFSFWKEAVDAEIYGSLVYFNGWTGPDGPHGHGVYVQNRDGGKLLADNIVFRNYSHGIHGYGTSDAWLDGISYVGNTVFSNGEPGGTFERNLLTGGGAVADRPVWDANMTWTPPPWGVNELGNDAGCVDATITNNFLIGASKAIDLVSCTPGLTMHGNTFVGAYPPGGFTTAQYPANAYLDAPPPAASVFVRPNRYEPGRANVTVYAWDGRSSVPVDVSGVLALGAVYELLDAQNVFGKPVLAGTYRGGALSVPLAGLAPAAPVGAAPLPPTGPTFNAFVLRTTAPPSPPVAAFTASDDTPLSGAPVAFRDTSSGFAAAWRWAFGDGEFSTDQNPTHAYAAPGGYVVALTVAGPAGSSSTRRVIAVAPSAQAPTRVVASAP